MHKFLQFNLKYFVFTILLFITEVIIAVYVHDSFVRPYIGDVLVVILIYCFFLSFLKLPKLKVAISTLLFAFVVETLQYFNFVQILGLQHSKLANIIIGNSFAWADMVAYVAGIIIVVVADKIKITTMQLGT